MKRKLVLFSAFVCILSFSGSHFVSVSDDQYPVEYRCSDKEINSLRQLGFPEYLNLYFTNETGDLWMINSDRSQLQPQEASIEIPDFGEASYVMSLDDSSKIYNYFTNDPYETHYWIQKAGESTPENLFKTGTMEYISFDNSGQAIRFKFLYRDLYEEGYPIWSWHYSPVEVIDMTTGESMDLFPTPVGAIIDDAFELDGGFYTIFHYEGYLSNQLWILNNLTGEETLLLDDLPEIGSNPNFSAKYEYGMIRLSIPQFEYTDKIYYREINFPLDDEKFNRALILDYSIMENTFLASAANGNSSYLDLGNVGFTTEIEQMGIYLFDLKDQKFINHCFTFNPQVESYYFSFLPSHDFAIINFQGIDELTNLHMLILNLETGEYYEIPDARFSDWSMNYVFGEGYHSE